MRRAQDLRVPSVLEDPSAQAIARVYANAFLDAASSEDAAGALEEFDSFLADVLAKNPEFESILLSGIVSRDDKVGLIDRAIAPHASPIFANFLRVLARHERLELLPIILGETRSLHETRCGQKHVIVKSAQALSDDAIGKIRDQLNETFDFEPIIDAEVDESLIGGLVIQVDDTVYDSSLRTRMKQLRSSLRERYLNEIQSGRDRFSHPEGD